jgi:hypothetical protein
MAVAFFLMLSVSLTLLLLMVVFTQEKQEIQLA